MLQDIVQLVKFKGIWDYQENLHSYIGVIISSLKKFLFEIDLFQKQERVLDRYHLKINLQRLTRRKL